MTKEEITDIDLDVMNSVNKLPMDVDYAHYYINANPYNIGTMGGGDALALTEGFLAVLERDDDTADLARNAMLSAVVTYLNDNKGQLKRFKKALKLMKQ